MEKNQISAENMEEKDIKNDSHQVYEISYLLLPSVTEANAVSEHTSFKSLVASFGGTIISEEHPTLIDLAYSMTKAVQTTRHKVTTAYFGWMKFTLSKEDIAKVKKALDGNDTVLRYLIIKTVHENTFVAGKMHSKKEDKNYPEDTEEAAPLAEVEAEPATTEEIDKSIDELVIA